MAILPATDLPNRIHKLLEEREQHANALAHIDQILAGVSATLKGAPVESMDGKKPAATAAPAAVKGKKQRRGRGHFAVSAEESILGFVKLKKNPTSAEINQHIKSEGRSSSANNALGKLVKEKKLKRTPIPGERGSRYSLG
jgi:hypothetical protein